MNCPNCSFLITPNASLESDWQLVRCKCGALVELGHGETVVRKPATTEDFRNASEDFKHWDTIYWRRYAPVYRELDFEFWQEANKLPEPPTDGAKKISRELGNIHNDLEHVRDRLNSTLSKYEAY